MEIGLVMPLLMETKGRGLQRLLLFDETILIKSSCLGMLIMMR